MELSLTANQALELKGVQLANNQQKVDGQASLQLLEAAAVDVVVSPSSPGPAVGNIINTTA